MMQIFANGHGGKHRNNADAAQWRFTTAQVATTIQATFPEMGRAIAITHAEDETSSAFRQINAAERAATLY